MDVRRSSSLRDLQVPSLLELMQANVRDKNEKYLEGISNMQELSGSIMQLEEALVAIQPAIQVMRGASVIDAPRQPPAVPHPAGGGRDSAQSWVGADVGSMATVSRGCAGLQRRD